MNKYIPAWEALDWDTIDGLMMGIAQVFDDEETYSEQEIRQQFLRMAQSYPVAVSALLYRIRHKRIDSSP